MFLEERQLGHYRLIKLIGGGGMGDVYLAEDIRLTQRQVAIKIIRAESDPYPDPTARQDAIRLFQREMRAITLLDHPNILTLLDFGEEKINSTILTYMVMPLRREGSFADWLQKQNSTRKLLPNEIAHFVKQAADALQHAHDHNIVHLDVKPANFLIRNRENNQLPDLLLTDFGIAKMNTATATTSQNIRGTAPFMAPEQWKGQVQPATDQYALAIMAYALLTGHPPFTGSVEQVMHQQLLVQPSPPRNYNAAISPALNAVIMRALEKQPNKRFPSILAFAQAFQQANSDQKTDPTLPKTKKATPNLADTDISHPISKQAKRRTPALLAIGVLFIISIIVAQTTYQNNMQHLNATATARAAETTIDTENATATSDTANKNATATSDTANKNATSTSVARINNNATATVIAATTQEAAANPYPGYFEGNSGVSPANKFVLHDPLSTESWWHTYSNNTGGECQFFHETYHVSESQTGMVMNCDNTYKTFSDFAFEVQMTIIRGDCGGMLFRRNSSTGQHYYFQVCQDGTYRIIKYSNEHAIETLRDISNASSINTGRGVQNTIAVTANGSIIKFYVNQQQIDQVNDDSYTEGHISLIAYPQDNHITEVAYSDARVWTL